MFRWMRDLRRARKRVRRALKPGAHFDIDMLAPRLRELNRAYRRAWAMNGAVEAMADEYAEERTEELESMLAQARLYQIQSDHWAAEWLDTTAELLVGKQEMLRLLREGLPGIVNLALHGGDDDADAVEARAMLVQLDPDRIDEYFDEIRRREALCAECAEELRRESAELADRAAEAIVRRHRS